MSPYMKRFVLASFFYLALTAVLGMVNGIFDVTYFGLYAHTHFGLLGFMTMIVFGVGYFILPRFNGTELKFPRWVPVHFWLANISLVGMVVFRGLSVETGGNIYQPLFIIFAAGQAVSLFMFVINIWLTLTPSSKGTPQVAPKGNTAAPPAPSNAPTSYINQTVQQTGGDKLHVTADTKIAELIDAVPSTKELFISAGLKSLAIPGYVEQVRKMGVTVGMAASRHGLDLNELTRTVEQEIKSHSNNTSQAVTVSPAKHSSLADTLTSDMLIGNVMGNFPETREVFQKYFGAGCFDCPGQMYESIDMACQMHGIDQRLFIQELNSVLTA